MKMNRLYAAPIALLVACGIYVAPATRPTAISTSQDLSFPSPESTDVTQVGQWKRFEVAYTNSTWNGNPFDVPFHAVFTHKSSGRVVTQLGFYAGDNTWKIFFMPDRVGEWTFVTSSPDPDLNGKTGVFSCVPSDLPGRLVGEGNRWRLQDTGEYVAPIMIPTREWFKRTKTGDGIDDFIGWADDVVGARIVGTTLVYFSHEQSEVPYVKGQEGQQFNIPMWDRLNSHFDMLRDHGMGHYIMFYSDDAESPNRWGIDPQSPEELRLFRYAVARFSAYPMILWDTGIDIGETRSDDWIDWFADWFVANDPWQHPVSSRTGGGSGGKFPENATYYSDGTSRLPNPEVIVNNWLSRSVPTAYTDRWREDYARGDFDRDRIRRAVWEVGLMQGAAVYVSGNENGGYLDETYRTDFRAAPQLGLRERFFRDRIANLGRLVPHNELIDSADSVVLSADPGREYVAYFPGGGSANLDLSAATRGASIEWYNPRTGDTTNRGATTAGRVVSFTAPDMNDWVLHVSARSVDFCCHAHLPQVVRQW